MIAIIISSYLDASTRPLTKAESVAAVGEIIQLVRNTP
jgi:hypothetical protein